MRGFGVIALFSNWECYQTKTNANEITFDTRVKTVLTVNTPYLQKEKYQIP